VLFAVNSEAVPNERKIAKLAERKLLGIRLLLQGNQSLSGNGVLIASPAALLSALFCLTTRGRCGAQVQE
jgi:hypothetical protein